MDLEKIYRRRLPHLTPSHGCFFVTFQLSGALPKSFMNKWNYHQTCALEGSERDRRWFQFLERGLEHSPQGTHWLKEPQIARIVFDAILQRHKDVYDLDCFTLMSNHVHMLFTPLAQGDQPPQPLSKIMHSLKSFTANAANQCLERKGAFWQHEGFDRLVRSPREWKKTLLYILNNPVRANYVCQWQDWPWTWFNQELYAFLE